MTPVFSLRLGGNTLRGNFATSEECDAYWRSRPAFEQNHSECVGCNKQNYSYNHSTYDDYSYQTGDPDQQLDFMLSMLFPIPIVDGVFRGGQWFFTDLFGRKTDNKSFGRRYTDTLCQDMPLKENGCSGGFYARLGEKKEKEKGPYLKYSILTLNPARFNMVAISKKRSTLFNF